MSKTINKINQKQAELQTNRKRRHKDILLNRRLRMLSCILLYEFVFFLSYLFSYLFRFDFKLEEHLRIEFIQSICLVLVVKTIIFSLQRHFRNDVLFASINSLKKICESAFYSFNFLFFMKYFVRYFFDLPFSLSSSSNSILFLDCALTVLLLGGIRFIARYMKEEVSKHHQVNESTPAYIVGADNEIARIANIINARKTTGFSVIGFVALDESLVKTEIDYIPIIGTVTNFIPKALNKNIKDILILAGFLPGNEFRSLFDICRSNGIKLHVIPPNEISTSQTIPIRSIDIVDLLKRTPVTLNTEQIASAIKSKRILVTGAGGSIGSEICRQILPFQPSELFILGRGENRIFFLERELRGLAKEAKITPLIADVTNEARINKIFKKIHPNFVFHAAAHKHVPLMEANVSEAIRNNVFGTKVVADAAERWDVQRFVLISTDKAVNPTSVMGTSKHMAERYVSAISENAKTQFIITRFGNVLGSNGSVIPIFKQQIEMGGPITITDFRMTRYFMTIPEASQLVLEASVIGKGGTIYVLDMGNPIPILDLAKDMIRLAGLPDNAIEIKEVGLRPGEKLYEELYFDSEQKINTPHPNLYAAHHREFKRELVDMQFAELFELAKNEDNTAIRQKLKEFVPEYHPTV